MMVLLRVIAWHGCKEFGLEKRFSTEQIDQAHFDVLRHEYELMKEVVEKDIQREKEKEEHA